VWRRKASNTQDGAISAKGHHQILGATDLLYFNCIPAVTARGLDASATEFRFKPSRLFDRTLAPRVVKNGDTAQHKQTSCG